MIGKLPLKNIEAKYFPKNIAIQKVWNLKSQAPVFSPPRSTFRMVTPDISMLKIKMHQDWLLSFTKI